MKILRYYLPTGTTYLHCTEFMPFNFDLCRYTMYLARIVLSLIVEHQFNVAYVQLFVHY